MQCAIDNLQSMLCNVWSTNYNPCCAMCDRQTTIHVVQCAINNLQSTIHIACAICDQQSTIHNVWAAVHVQSRHRKWTSEDCWAIVLVEALQLDSDCSSLLRPLRRSHRLCVFTMIHTNALRSLQRGCRKTAVACPWVLTACMCIISKTPAQEPWALCIYINKYQCSEDPVEGL